MQGQLIDGLYLNGNNAQFINQIQYQNDTKQTNKSTINSKTDVITLIAKNRKQVKQLGQETTKESQQQILQLQDNKILMSQLCQPMIIHSHRIASNNKQLTHENQKLKKSLNLDTHQNIIKLQHFQKKGGQVRQSQMETKPWYPFERIKRKHKLLTAILGQKQNPNTQNHQIVTHFQSMADLTGWQINEDPQIEIIQ